MEVKLLAFQVFLIKVKRHIDIYAANRVHHFFESLEVGTNVVVNRHIKEIFNGIYGCLFLMAFLTVRIRVCNFAFAANYWQISAGIRGILVMATSFVSGLTVSTINASVCPGEPL